MPDFQKPLREAFDHIGDPSIVPLLEALMQQYRDASAKTRLKWLDQMAATLEIAELPALASGKLDLASPDSVGALLAARQALRSDRSQLLAQFANVPAGVKFLVDLRADLLNAIKANADRPALQLLEADLFELFQTWFNFGFLQLRPINWEATPAAQLEKLMAFDTVHPMASWDELRRRLQRDRLCYAFFHPNMPGEPLVFVEIALTKTITSSIDRLFLPELAIDKLEDAATAIFYSINNTQPGLAGVSLGNSLIKTVVADLQLHYPMLRRFSTLSPMPGLRDRYLTPLLARDAKAKKFALQPEQLESFFDKQDAAALCDAGGKDNLTDALAVLLADDEWAKSNALRMALKAGLLRIAHFYLACEKRGPKPVNPVANFHLSNGATLYNLNYLSNTGPKGMAESYGMTVNYHYDLKKLDDNRQAMRSGQVSVAPQLERMLSLGVSG